MKKIIASLIAFFVTINLYSQNQDVAYPHVVPMTPDAAQFAKYSDIPVSHYTGTPNINIPLYEVNMDGFKLPIALNYHASGIRVDQEATWVGLGWSLDVGSRISRVVKSADDFLIKWDRSYPYCIEGYYGAPEITSNIDNHYMTVLSNACEEGVFGIFTNHLLYDSEPDIFYYNLPNLNGKFILDKSRGAVLFDKSHNLKIEVIINNNTGKTVTFKVTDSEGIQYFYNKWETTENYLANNYWLNKNIHTLSTVYDDSPSSFIEWEPFRDGGCITDWSPAPNVPVPLVTSWCLSKIITKNSREINFTYEEEDQYLPTQESCENYNYYNNPSTYNHQSALHYYKSKIVNKALRLKTIDGDFGKIEFVSSSRLDIKGNSKKLDGIQIRDAGNILLKSFKFDYTYFNNNYSGPYQYEHVFKRLKLDKVTEWSALEPLNEGYVFDYYQGDFPAKNSKNVDYWGYQNGKEYGQNYYIGIHLPNNIKYLGVKKDANFAKAVIGTLKKITYPTKGVEEFKFESNKIASGYFQTHTADVSSSTDVVNFSVYNDYIVHEYSEFPAQRVYTFNITGRTAITINGRIENAWGQRDPDYNYYSAALGRFRNINSPNSMYKAECPYVFYESIPDGLGTETTLPSQYFILEPGTYEFTAYTPPKDVITEWRFDLNYLYTPVIPPGTPLEPFDAGGIRISEIKNDGKTRKFNYPLGTMLWQPVLFYLGRRDGIPTDIESCIVQVSESKAPPSLGAETMVGYDWVEESISDEQNNISKVKYTFYNDNETEVFDDNFPGSPRHTNHKNGLVKSVEKFNNSTCVEREDFTYNSTYSNTINAFKDLTTHKLSGKVFPYNYQIEWPLTSRVISTLKTNEGQSVLSETSYSYNSNDLLRRISKKSSTDSLFITEYKYPGDFIGQQPYTDMVNVKHIVSPVIEQSTYKNSVTTPNLLQSTKTNYSYWNNNSNRIYPVSVETKSLAANYNARLRYHGYDDQGNIKELSKENGVKINYLYSYKGQYPIAKIENAEYSAIESLLGGPAIESLKNDPNPDISTLNDLFTNLRTGFPNAQVTGYTYKPLVGVTSMMDPRGQKTTYEYDSFQRLARTKDHSGNIIKEFCYNYAGMQTLCPKVTAPGPVIPTPGGGGSDTLNLYARVEYENLYVYDGYSGDNRVIQKSIDVFFKFYSDSACTESYSLANNLKINSYGKTTHYYNGGEDPPNYDFYERSVSAGNNSFDFGSYDIYTYNEYAYDPVWGYLYDLYIYEHQLSQGAGYQALPSILK